MLYQNFPTSAAWTGNTHKDGTIQDFIAEFLSLELSYQDNGGYPQEWVWKAAKLHDVQS